MTAIGNTAFDECLEISSLDLSNCTNLETIGNSAFLGCDQILSLNLSNCTNLKTIGDSAFYACYQISSLNLSSCTNLKTIGNSAFSSCREIPSLDLSKCTNLQTIGIYAFAECLEISSLNLSNCTNLETIGDSAFNGCSQISSLNLSDCTNLKTIGESAFSTCNQIPSLDLSSCTNLTTIGSQAFYKCSNLSTLKLPSSLTSIGMEAFTECQKIPSLDLSKCTVLKEIGDSAFSVCSGIESLSLPKSIDTIGQGAFKGISKIPSLDLSKCTALSSIPGTAFAECSSLKSLILPSSLERVCDFAFASCPIETIFSYNKSAPSIFDDSFDRSANLKIYVPDESIVNYRQAWTKFRDLIHGFDEIYTKLSSPGEGLISTYHSYSKKIKISGYGTMYDFTGKRTPWADVDYDNVFIDSGVKNISPYAFAYNSKLISVNVGARVEEISGTSFLHCDRLSNININPLNPNFQMDNNILYKTNNGVAEKCIFGLQSMTGDINIDNNVETIGAQAFQGHHISKITLPNKLTTIENQAFADCYNLKTLVFQTGRPDIAEDAFLGLNIDLYYPATASGWNPSDYTLGGATHINYKPMVNPQDVSQLKTAVTDVSPANTNILISKQFELTDTELLRVEGTKNLIAVDGGNLKVTNTCFHVPANATLNLNGVTFSGHVVNASNPTNSKATSTGLAPIPFTEDVLTASNDEFYKNAVIYNYGTTNVDNCSFTDNSVLYSTIFNSGTLNVGVNSSNPVTFKKCTSTYKDANTWGGGALYNNGEATLNNCVFEDCSGHCGGAIHNVSKLTLNKSSFTGCTAENGAAIYNTGAQSGATKYFGDLVLNDCTISACTATQHGSAVVSRHDAKLTFDGTCMIYGNGADDVYLDKRYSDSSNSTFCVGNTFYKDESRIGITAINPSAGITVCASIDDSQWSVDTPPFVSCDDGHNIVKSGSALIYG